MTKLRSTLIKIFRELAEAEDDNFFKARAFSRVANWLEQSNCYSISCDRVILKNSDSGFSQVLGASSSAVFIEYVTSSTCSRLGYVPVDIEDSDLLNITGIGEVRARELNKAKIFCAQDLTNLHLGIGDIIPGTNLKFSQQMMIGLKAWNATHGKRISRAEAESYISDFKAKVREDIFVLGSYRRMKPTLGDIDIVMVNNGVDYTDKIIEWLDSVLVQGDTKIAGIKGETQVDVRIIDPKYLGAHILHGTGSQEFNIKLRAHAKSLGMKLNEYGVYDTKGEFHTFSNEEAVFEFLGLIYVPPERR